MIQFYTQTHEYLVTVHKKLISRSVKEIVVASFGLKSTPGFTTLYKIMSVLNCKSAKVLIGLSKDGLNFDTRLLQDYPGINWRFSFTSHLKGIGVRYTGTKKWAICGGRNLTESTWDDLSIAFEGKSASAIFAHLKSKWSQGISHPPCVTEFRRLAKILDKYEEAF